MITRRACISVFAVIFATIIFAEDNVDRFILPEAPPTIERVEKPPIDKPLLKKQNFIPEADINSSPIWQNANFKPFEEESFPAKICLSRGAYRSVGIDALFTSQNGYQFSLGEYSTDGETPVLAKRKTYAQFLGETDLGSSLIGDTALNFLTRALNGQQKDLYSASYALSWYGGRTFNMKAKAGWSFADVASLDKNDSVYGEIESNWQAFDGDNLSLNAVASRDTAFTGFSRDYKLGLLNEMFLLGDMAAGLGARYQDEHLYPLARLTWRPFSRGCFTASYEPGMIKPDWASLYVADSFVSINNDLPVCENVFALKESFSYYWGKQGEGNIEFYQEHQRNGVYWVRDALNNTIMPITLDDMFRSGCTIKAVYGGKYFKPECNIALSGQKDLPFTPQYSADIKLGLRYGVFTLTPAINTVGERRASLNGELMAGYSDISCKIAYDVKNDVTLAVEALNISGEAIETQPGFVQHLPSAQGSVEFRF